MSRQLADWIRGYLPPRKAGQGLPEYALILALLAIGTIGGLLIVGRNLAEFFRTTGRSF